MIIHWIPLLCGLFFGLIPPKLLLTSECRYMRFDTLWNRIANPHKSPQRRRRWWKLPMVWIDPVRGYLVGDFLSRAFTLDPLSTGLAKVLPLIATFLVLAVVVWVQTRGREEAGETLSPTAFLGGMMIALLPLVVALSAIALAASTTVVMRRFAAGYVIAALTTACIGYFFMSKTVLATYTVVVAMPLLIAWLRRSSLVMPVRS